jgi:hypothetical protein
MREINLIRAFHSRVKFFFLLFIVFSPKSQAQETFYWVYPSYDLMVSALEKAQPHQEFQVSLMGQNFHTDIAPSAWGVSAWYSPFHVEDPILSGWTIVTTLAHSIETHQEALVVGPEAWIYELGLGRTLLFGESTFGVAKDMGFRGHFEIAFRGLMYPVQSRVLAEVYGRGTSDTDKALFLKWGAGTSVWGDGLVAQKVSGLGFHLEGAIGLPIRNSHAVILSLLSNLYLSCGIKGVRCGVEIMGLRVGRGGGNAIANDVRNVYRMGPYMEWHSRWNVSLKIGIPWLWVQTSTTETSSSEIRGNPTPGLNLNLSIGL